MREKTFHRNALIDLLQKRRAAQPGFRLAFASGCFDLLHPGHVQFLWEARRAGDALCVALFDDAAAARLKGAGRPVLALRERLQLIAGLTCVDFVTWIEEDDPLSLIRDLAPATVARTEEDCLSAIAGAAAAPLTVPVLPGQSASVLIEKVRAVRK